MTNLAAEESAPARGLELKVVGGDRAGTKIVVEGELVLGRQTDGEGQFADSEMSRRHARIARGFAEDYGIEDLGSSNGTIVNGTRISAPTLLSTGDTIELGGAKLVVRALTSPAPATAATPPTLAVRLEVDFEAGTAAVALDEAGDMVTMKFVDGHWRAV